MGKKAEYNPPPPPKLKQAPELFQSGINFGKTNAPLAYGAREKALSQIDQGALVPGADFYEPYNLVSPEQLSPDYFSQFQPTSFEQALASQQFQNILPESERKILHGLSLSGIESSPVLAQLLAQNYGNLAVPIGEYLANQGQRRAELGLQRYDTLSALGQRRGELGLQGIQQGIQAGLDIDPYSTYSPYLETDMGQSNSQAMADYQAALQRAQTDYQNAQAKAVQKRAMISSIGSIIGGAGGFMLGGPAGAGFGASLGGSAASLFGGSGTPFSFQDAMSIGSMFPGQTTTGKVQSVSKPSSTSNYRSFKNPYTSDPFYRSGG